MGCRVVGLRGLQRVSGGPTKGWSFRVCLNPKSIENNGPLGYYYRLRAIILHTLRV